MAGALTGSACDGGGATCPANYPEPAFAESAPELGGPRPIHVAASCDVSNPDGSAARPFDSVGAALEAAREQHERSGGGSGRPSDSGPPGPTVLVAPGTYEERVVLQTPHLDLVGSSSPEDPSQAAATIRPPDGDAGPAVTVRAGDVMLVGLAVEQARTAGVFFDGGSGRLLGSRIEGTRSSPQGDAGDGVVAVGPPGGIILQHNVIEGSERVGVLIQDPLSGGGAGVHVTDNRIADNARGGIRLEDVRGDGQAECNVSPCRLVARNEVVDNVELGIGVLSSDGIILQSNTIEGTTRGGPADGADGILVDRVAHGEGELGPPSRDVTIGGDDAELGNTVADNERVGVLVGGKASGIILQNEATGSGRAGIWLQGEVGEPDDRFRIEANTIEANRFLGVSVGAGTHVALQNNTIRGTEQDSIIHPDPDDQSSVEMGDGIGVFDGASARVQNNEIVDNARAGFLGDALAGGDTRLVGNTYDSNPAGGIILQHVPEDGGPAETDAEPEIRSDEEALSVLPQGEAQAGFDVGARVGPSAER